MNTLTYRELHSEVRRQQLQGCELAGAFHEARLGAPAGVRRTRTVAHGEHMFVDDLPTDSEHQGGGYVTALLRWLARRGAAEGSGRISVPCWMEVAHLAEPAAGGVTRRAGRERIAS